MTTNIQAKWDALKRNSYTGTQEDMELAFYRAGGATSYSLPDAEMQYLVVLGFTTGTTTDRWKAYLNSLTYTGSVDDMLKVWWEQL